MNPSVYAHTINGLLLLVSAIVIYKIMDKLLF
jgi:hypothetical protein